MIIKYKNSYVNYFYNFFINNNTSFEFQEEKCYIFFDEFSLTVLVILDDKSSGFSVINFQHFDWRFFVGPHKDYKIKSEVKGRSSFL